MRNSPSQGFTLIQMSLVMVIMGLLAGATVAGRSLYQEAELRRYMKRINDIQAAYATFKEQYNCVPGDCGNASTYFSGAVDGNNNGLISYSTSESGRVWHHLTLAGLITYPTTDLIGSYRRPAVSGDFFLDLGCKSPTNNAQYVTYASQGDLHLAPYVRPDINHLSVARNLGGLSNRPAFTVLESYSIDKKMDDGLARSGSVYGLNASSDAGVLQDCEVSGTYSVNNQAMACRMLFSLGGG